MAGVSVGGGGHGGKKSVDHEIPLIPFIDLLLCCVMFLLVTAVWNQLARLDANQQAPGQPSEENPVEPDVKVVVQVTGTGFVIASTAGERTEIPKAGDDYDMEQLRQKLEERKQLEPNKDTMTVAPEDGVMYNDVTRTMDLVIGAGFKQVTLSDGAGI